MAVMPLPEFAEKLGELMPEVMRGFTRRETSNLIKSKITMAQFFVLNHLLKQQESMMKDIARVLNVTTAAATGIVDRLVKYGYIQRIFDAADRRIIRIKLTPRGAELVRKVNAEKKKRVMEVFGKLGDPEREQYLTILSRINDILKQETDA